jgi:hypothetical protein
MHVVDATAGVKLFFWQRLQGESPEAVLKLPSGHALHAPSSKVNPALHSHASQYKHSDKEVGAVTGKYFPSRQTAHEAFVAGHSVQMEAPWFGENFPTVQVMHVASELAPFSCEYVPFPQLTHVFSESAPVNPENKPAAHLVHKVLETAPSTIEYVPLSHSLQFANPLISA